MQVAVGTVKFPAENRTAASGREYCSVAIAIDGQEQLTRMFGPPGHQPFQQLQKGQRIQVGIDSQGRAHLLENAPAAPMGFQTQPSAPAPSPAPQVQHQAPPQYQAAPAPTPAPAAPASPILDMADQWAIAFARLVAAGVPPEQAGAGASCCMIQTFGRR